MAISLLILFFLQGIAGMVIYLENDYGPLHNPEFFSSTKGNHLLPSVIRGAEKKEIVLDGEILLGSSYRGMISYDLLNEERKLCIAWKIDNPRNTDNTINIFSAQFCQNVASEYLMELILNGKTELLGWNDDTDPSLSWFLSSSSNPYMIVQLRAKSNPFGNTASTTYYIRSASSGLYLRPSLSGKVILENYNPDQNAKFAWVVTPLNDTDFFLKSNDGFLMRNSLSNTFQLTSDQNLKSSFEISPTKHNWHSIRTSQEGMYIDASSCKSQSTRYPSKCFQGSEILLVNSYNLDISAMNFEFIRYSIYDLEPGTI